MKKIFISMLAVIFILALIPGISGCKSQAVETTAAPETTAAETEAETTMAEETAEALYGRYDCRISTRLFN